MFCLWYAHTIISNEYVYPVANLDDNTILMMHQKSLDELELFALDTTTHTKQKMLSSLYFPAHVCLMPNKKGYSFIDRGRIYIKDLLKRTPRSIDIYQSICDIQSVQWINDNQLIFSAKFKNRYKICMYDVTHDQGQLYSLCSLHDDINYIFPSAVDQENLFCLTQHDGSEFYQVTRMKIEPTLWEHALKNKEKECNKEIIPLEHHKPLCFLKMMDLTTGYVLEMTQHNHENKIFSFKVYKIDIPNTQLQELFKFDIPEKFIIGSEQERFYESLYPLLPRYQHDKIYFTNFDHES